jgi:hypothetical protein
VGRRRTFWTETASRTSLDTLLLPPPRGKAAETWSWQLSSIYCRGWEGVEPYCHSAIRLRGMHRDNFTQGLPLGFVCSNAGPLAEVSVHPEGPSNGQIGQGFPWSHSDPLANAPLVPNASLLQPTPFWHQNSAQTQDLRNVCLQDFTLPSTYIYQKDKREERGNMQKSSFCFPVINAMCVCVCVYTSPPPPKKKLVPPRRASMRSHKNSRLTPCNGPSYKTWAWRRQLMGCGRRNRNEICGYPILHHSGGRHKQMFLLGHSISSYTQPRSNPDILSQPTWLPLHLTVRQIVCTWRGEAALSLLHDDGTTGQAGETVGGKGRSWAIYYPDVCME